MSTTELLQRLECNRGGCACHVSARRGHGQTHCPAHKDDKPSLSLTEKGGQLLWHCHGGCSQEAVTAALRAFESDQPRTQQIVATYDYQDTEGQLLYQTVRFQPKNFRQRKPDGKGGWEWSLNGTSRVLYRLPELLAQPERWVFLVEGEKDADRLRQEGLLATCYAGGAKATWNRGFSESLRGRSVAILCDADEAGITRAQRDAKELRGFASEVRVLELPGLERRASHGQDVSDWLDLDNTVEDLKRLVLEVLPGEPSEPAQMESPPPPWLTPVGVWLDNPGEEPDWLVDGLIIIGGVCLFGAKPKVGKTTLLHQLALAVARGERFLGRKTRQGPVIYLALEEDRSRLMGRLLALGVRRDDPLHLLVGQAPQTGFQKLYQAARELEAVLAIVDPIQRLTRLEDINDYSQVSNATDPLIAMARETGCAVTFSHHLGKTDRDSGDQILGSTALFGSVDTAVIIRKQLDTKVRTLETQQRYGSSWDPVVLGHSDETGASWLLGTVEEYERDQGRKVILDRLADQVGPVTQEALLRDSGLRWGEALQVLRTLVLQHVVEQSGSGRRGNPLVYSLNPLHLPETVSLPTDPAAQSEFGQGMGKEWARNGQGMGKETEVSLPGGISAEYNLVSLPPEGVGKENLAPNRCPSCQVEDYQVLEDGLRECWRCGGRW